MIGPGGYVCGGPVSGLGAGNAPHQLVSSRVYCIIYTLHFMVEFYGNMIILCICVKHEMFTLLLVDMCIGMYQKQCLY